MGVTLRHPRGGLSSPTATGTPAFRGRDGFAWRWSLAPQVGRYAAIDFLLPLGKKNCGMK
jgi:hypothetical protein